MKYYESEETRNDMYRERHDLMEVAEKFLQENHGKSPDFYNLQTHRYLQEHGWELLFPLDEDQWSPDFREITCDSAFNWPGGTTYNYVMSVLFPPEIPYLVLCFGYAVLEGRLVPCAFFVVQRMVDYQIMPQGMVIDPLAVREGKKPTFYIGCPVDKEDIQNCLMRRKHPLELYAERRSREDHDKDVYELYLYTYIQQVAIAPGWFRPELIEFAKREGLPIPPQERKTAGMIEE